MKGQVITHDYGLGTAYERYCFYQWLDRIADAYGVESFLEGPIDGMAGVPGTHGVGLAKRGIKVTAAFDSEAQAAATRAIYEGENAKVDTRVVSETDLSSLPQSDMVVCYHALSFVGDWNAYLRAVAKLAKKVLVVTVCNPDTWGITVIRAAGRLRGQKGLEPPPEWQTKTLAPVLWELGLVKEHEYFDCPWWPDLQVSPGQSLSDRIRSFFGKKEPMEFTAKGGELAKKHVYGAGRWAYFGGPGWHEELLPALLMHPGFDGGPQRLRALTAHLHGFVVDVRPRTPQARRRVPIVAA